MIDRRSARLLLLLTLLASSVIAAAPRPLAIGDYLSLRRISGVAVSPDGSRIVYEVASIDPMKDRWATSLCVMRVDGSGNVELGRGNGASWSPDGARIAYVSPDAKGNSKIFVREPIANATPRQITSGELWPSALHWSPDGTSIGFAGWIERGTTPWAIDMPTPPAGAKWSEPPHVTDSLHYHVDGAGYVDSGTTHLFVVPVTGGQPRQITHGDWSAGFWWDGNQGTNWSWSPDGKTIVFDALTEADRDLRYEDCDINAVDVASGAMRKLTTERGLWSAPVVSPDGRWVAFNGFAAKRESYHSQELYVVPLAGGAAKKISGNLDRDVAELTWAADSSGVYFTAQDRGSQAIEFADLGGHVRRITSGAEVYSLAGVTRSRVAVAVRTSLRSAQELVAIPVDAPQRTAQLTHLHDELLSGVALADVSEVHFPSSDKADIQGWLYRPVGFDAQKKYPLILLIHGGPVIMGDTRFSFRAHYYAARGFFVLTINPRSGSGYGTGWTNGVSFAMPGLDYDDLMRGVDWALSAQPSIDPKRLYVGGGSYGGTLTAWTIGHTDRFAAAVVESPNIDWISWSGTSDLPLSGTGFFFRKPFWDDPKQWLDHSPLMYAGRMKTPTLIITGENDLRTPPGQAEELYAALMMRKVPTRLLRFPGDSHLGIAPSHVMRRMQYALSWMGMYDGRVAG